MCNLIMEAGISVLELDQAKFYFLTRKFSHLNLIPRPNSSKLGVQSLPMCLSSTFMILGICQYMYKRKLKLELVTSATIHGQFLAKSILQMRLVQRWGTHNLRKVVKILVRNKWNNHNSLIKTSIIKSDVKYFIWK